MANELCILAASKNRMCWYSFTVLLWTSCYWIFECLNFNEFPKAHMPKKLWYYISYWLINIFSTACLLRTRMWPNRFYWVPTIVVQHNFCRTCFNIWDVLERFLVFVTDSKIISIFSHSLSFMSQLDHVPYLTQSLINVSMKK